MSDLFSGHTIKRRYLFIYFFKRGFRCSRMSGVCHQISSNIVTLKIPDMVAAMAEIQQPLEIIINSDEQLKSPGKHLIGGDSPWIRIMELDPYRHWTTCRVSRQNPDGCRDLLFQVHVQFFFSLRRKCSTLLMSNFPPSSVSHFRTCLARAPSVIFTATSVAFKWVQHLS